MACNRLAYRALTSRRDIFRVEVNQFRRKDRYSTLSGVIYNHHDPFAFGIRATMERYCDV